MRTIKFRGKSIFNNKWVYGLPKFSREGDHYLIEDENGMGYDIYNNTLGEFTGLKDKNGKDVFEGDLITRPCAKVVEVVFDDKNLLWGIRGKHGLIEGLFEYGIKDWEIVGNIYQNPELLK